MRLRINLSSKNKQNYRYNKEVHKPIEFTKENKNQNMVIFFEDEDEIEYLFYFIETSILPTKGQEVFTLFGISTVTHSTFDLTEENDRAESEIWVTEN